MSTILIREKCDVIFRGEHMSWMLLNSLTDVRGILRRDPETNLSERSCEIHALC